MPRSLWTGSLSFGLVNVPVQVVSAVRDLDLHFRQLHEKDKSPIETQRWCSEEDKEVPFDAITRSYELDSGKSVIVTDEDLEAVEPRKTRTIDIEQFVDLADVDPIYFDHPYWLVPAGDDEGASRAYKLLLGVMEKTDHAALGRFVMRAKEHLAIVRARDGALTLTTMRFHDEVRSPKDVPSASGKSTEPSKQQLDAAVDLIEALADDWDPSKHEDRYRKRLQKVVDKKRKGQTIEIEDEGAEEGKGGEVPDLMAALERSLADARKGSGRGKSRSSKGGSKAKSAG
jgi:DNA end-binding protein Ku